MRGATAEYSFTILGGVAPRAPRYAARMTRSDALQMAADLVTKIRVAPDPIASRAPQ